MILFGLDTFMQYDAHMLRVIAALLARTHLGARLVARHEREPPHREGQVHPHRPRRARRHRGPFERHEALQGYRVRRADRAAEGGGHAVEYHHHLGGQRWRVEGQRWRVERVEGVGWVGEPSRKVVHPWQSSRIIES